MSSHKTPELFVRNTLGTLLLLVGFNALGGGFYGMTGAKNIPVEWLKGSPFHNYFLPSLVLFLFVGSSALLAAILVLKRNRYARNAALVCSLILLCWLIMQIIIIGYVSWLQPAMAFAAILVLLLTQQLQKYEH